MSNSTCSSSPTRSIDVDESCGILGLTQTLFTINFINSFLHGFGTYILAKIVQQIDSKPQHIFLLGLSSSECLMNFLDCVYRITIIICNEDVPHGVSVLLQIINFSGTWFVVYFMMVYITLDRLLFVTLHVKYNSVVTRRRAIIIFTVTWIVGMY